MVKTPMKSNLKCGKDASFSERMEVVCRFIFLKQSRKLISKEMKRNIKFVRRWVNRADDVLVEGSVQSRRKGNVGRKKTYSEEERNQLAAKLMGTTQIALANKLGICRKTLRKYS